MYFKEHFAEFHLKYRKLNLNGSLKAFLQVMVFKHQEIYDISKYSLICYALCLTQSILNIDF